MSWKDTILEAFDVFGPASLFVLSFTEAIVQPIPPDLLYIPMLVNAMGDTPLVVWLWLVVTVASVLGSLVGYWIGQRWGTSLMKRFGQEKHLTKLEQNEEQQEQDAQFKGAQSADHGASSSCPVAPRC